MKDNFKLFRKTCSLINNDYLSILCLFLLIGIYSCNKKVYSPTESEEGLSIKRFSNQIAWVNCLEWPCKGLDDISMKKLKREIQLDSVKWNLYKSLYNLSERDVGYTYKLSINEITFDDYSKEYILFDIKRYKLSDELAIKGTWWLEEFEGVSIEDESIGPYITGLKPNLTFKINSLKFRGEDGCNYYFGTLSALENSKIEFGVIGHSELRCQGKLANEYFDVLKRTRQFIIENSELVLFDVEGKKILKYIR